MIPSQARRGRPRGGIVSEETKSKIRASLLARKAKDDRGSYLTNEGKDIMTNNMEQQSSIQAEISARVSRGEDHATRAAIRLAEIRGSLPEGGDNRDKFWAPRPPDHYDYQWKRRTIYNQEDPSYQVELARNGWEPVPLNRHPDMMPKGWPGNVIEIEGLVLMERPLVLTIEARQREGRSAREAVATKEAQLGASRTGDLGRREVQRFSKTREAIVIPEE